MIGIENTIHSPDEILKNLGFYHEECMRNQDFALFYGPSVVSQLDMPAILPAIQLSNKDDLTMYECMLYTEFSVRLMESSINKLDAKKKLAEQICKIDGSITIPRNMYRKINMREILKQMISYTGTGISSESVLLNCAPIVPYQGIIKKLGMETNEDCVFDLSDLHKSVINPILDDVYLPGEDEREEHVEKHMHHEMKLRQAIEVLFFSNPVGVLGKNSFITSNDQFVQTIRSISNNSPQWYHLLTFYLFWIFNDPKKFETYTKMHSGNILHETTESMIEDMYDFYPDRSKPSMDSENNAKEKENFELHNSINTLSSYPIQNLKDYISRHRQYVASKYTSSMFFQKNTDIDHSIMSYKDIPFAEVHDKYLVAPVVDASASYSPVLIVMDRIGNIHVNDSLITIEL